ncbi:MAG: hypothetical protein WCL30_00320 [Pseudomonadota bacterium]
MSIPVNIQIKRYIWQDFSMQRIIAMPAVIFTILYLTYLFKTPSKEVLDILSTSFLTLVFIWGGYNAAGSVVEEVKNNTWDNQRLSPTSPFILGMGKLIGSTLYNWYGGIIILAIYTFYSLITFDSSDNLILSGFAATLYKVVMFVLCGFFCQAIAMLISVQALISEKQNGKAGSIAYLLLGLAASIPFQTYTSTNFNSDATLLWFGSEINANLFMLCSLITFLAWVLIAIYRSIGEELLFKNTPVAWAGFLVFIMLYVSGFTPSLPHKGYDFAGEIDWVIAILVAEIATYIMLFADKISITRYRNLLYRIEQKNTRKICENIPRWAASFSLMLVAIAVLTVHALDFPKFKVVFIFNISLVLFLIRDAAIIHYFKFSGSKSAGIAAIFYFAVLYVLLPPIFCKLFGNDALTVFYPIANDDAGFTMLIPIMLEISLIGHLLFKSCKKINLGIESRKNT